MAKECASTGIMLIANKESKISNPLGVEISNAEVEKHTLEFMDMLKKGELYKVERYSSSFVAQVAFNSALLALGNSVPLNFFEVVNKNITPIEAVGNVIKDICISAIGSAASASIAKSTGRIIALSPGVNSIISCVTGYGASIIGGLVFDTMFDSSKDAIQNPPIRF